MVQLKSARSELLREFHIEHRTTPMRASHCNPAHEPNTQDHGLLIRGEKSPAVGRIPSTSTVRLQHRTPRGHRIYAVFDARARTRLPDDRRHAENVTPHIIRRRLEEAFEMVQVHQARAFQRQEAHYNLRRNWRVGEKMWKREYPLSNKAAGFNAKFVPRYVGPLQIHRIISPVVVDLRDPRGR